MKDLKISYNFSYITINAYSPILSDILKSRGESIIKIYIEF